MFCIYFACKKVTKILAKPTLFHFVDTLSMIDSELDPLFRLADLSFYSLF